MAIDIVTQKGVSLKLEDKWAKKGYRLDRLIAREHISQPYEIIFDLTADESDTDFKSLMGKSLSAKFEFGKKTRYFEGIVGAIKQKATTYDTELTAFEIRLYPKLWTLQFNRNYKIFQNKNAITIIKDILKKHKITKIRDDTKTRGKTSRVYCVQYGESDLHFVERLMEEEGIFYFFDQSKDGHTLILADSLTSHKAFAGNGDIDSENAIPQPGFLNALFDFHYEQNMIPKGYSLQDYNFKTPSTDLKGEAKGQGLGETVFEYPGQTGFEEDPKKDINKTLSSLRLEVDEARQELATGMTTFPEFGAGSTFTLKGHERKSFNKKYTLIGVEHRITTDIPENQSETQLIYQNHFQAIPATKVFRPLRHHTKHKVDGIQTATVVGPKNKEIHTDKFGRIKIMFHWDTERKKDENSSCWVRTAQNWGDKNWGFVFIPRIGQEVIVTFLNGDPDRPIVTGCVYNGDKTPPYLPATPTKSTIKTNSVGVPKGKPVGFNELRFEDKYNAEEIYLHAQKDWNTHVIENRDTKIEKGSDTKIIERGDRSVTLKGLDKPVKGKGNDTLIIEKGSRETKLLAKGAGKGNYKIYMKNGDRTLTIDMGNQTITLKKGNRKVTLNAGNEDVTLKSGNQTISINAGTRTIKVMKDEVHKNMANFKQSVTKNYTLQVIGNVDIKATGAISMQSAQKIEMKAPQLIINVAAKLEVQSGGMIDIKSAAMFQMKAGAVFQLNAGAAIMMKAAAAAQFSAGAAFMAQAGAAIVMKAGAAILSDAAIQLQKSSGPLTMQGMPIIMA